jgi:thioester reductase-like protein
MAAPLSALQLALLASRADEQRQLLQAEPIAVVGVGCRFPAGAGRDDACSADAYWQLLADGVDAVREVPPSRWSLARYFDSTPGTPGKMHCRHGGFLQQIDRFDPASFGLSPKESAAMDPQHRLLLEVATEALESAALAPSRLKGMRAGVYVGLCTGDYAWRQLSAAEQAQRPEALDLYFATGVSFSMAAGRLAYVLGLTGPAMAVDTACSSSLVAVDLAVRALRDRTTDLALAGGVSLLLSPVNSICFARGGMLSSDGHCKTFDAAADGYVRGEGCGVVVMKRLADALAAGDPIWAVVRGTGVNQDGASAGLTVPSGEAQAQLIQTTLAQAQLDGAGIAVVEAHGTGTPLGDPIELKALAPIYGRPDRPAPLLLGSVKTNLGHLEGAAGVAGLIKAILMVQRAQVPAHLHLRRPTPFVPWDQWAISIPTVLTDWPQTQGPRRAAVSSFGFSGTNAHVIVEAAPAEAALPWPRPLPAADWLLLSARTPTALRQLAAAMAAWLVGQPEQAWAAICATSREARASGRWRMAIAATTAADASQQLLHSPPEPQCCPVGELRLAWQLQPELNLEQARHAMASWQGLQVVPTALVHPAGPPSWLADLVGDPPEVRLIALDSHQPDDLKLALERHGYGLLLPLQTPRLEQVVELWLAGGSPSFTPFEPERPWPRQVLPTTPFDRSPCWVEEATPAEVGAGECQASDGHDAPAIDLERQWTPIPGGSALAAGPMQLERVDAVELAAAPCLDQAFWARWLPRLQASLQAPHPVHWVLEADPSTAGAQAQAIAALLRTWMREAGATAGGLIWAGAHGEHLDQILASGTPPSGGEWRWAGGQVEGQVEVVALRPIPAERLPRQQVCVRPDATYLITGGLGALGLATARWLVDRGAKKLVLVARRRPSPEQQAATGALVALGCAVEIEPVDVADPRAVRGLLERLVSSDQPLRGIVHAAGVLDDGLISQQTPERCSAVAAAKLGGAIALDQGCRELAPALDVFVTYSSLAAVVGSPGQVAYAAANGALDGLMAERQRQGLVGLSVNWGPWAGAGMAAQAIQRLECVQPAAALTSLGCWLTTGVAQAVVADLREAGHNPLLPRCQQLLQELEQASAEQQQLAMQRCLADLLAALGGFQPQDLQPEASLYGLGFDSLMAVELAATVQAGLGVSLGLGAFAEDPSLASLSQHLLRLLGALEAAPLGVLNLADEARLPAELTAQIRSQCSAAGRREDPPEAVLLTGATGFLGAFLLADQLRRYPSLTVFCLVRADTAGAAKARVRANLEHYQLWNDAFSSRIVGVPGDLARPQLGLAAATWASLAERLDGILHNGAQLSYVAPYSQLKGPNVDGTTEVLRLAAVRGIAVEYISSTAVYEAAAYRGRVIAETDDLPAWEGIHLGYSQSKWVSERLVLAAAAAGLPVTVYRPPLIGGHSQTGEWHEGDFLHRLMRGSLALGQAPALAMALDLVPVDYVVAAIGALAWRAQPLGFHVHLHHPEPVLWEELLEALIARGAPLRPMPLEPWLAALAQQSSNPLYPLQPFFSQRWGPEQLTYPELNGPGVKAQPSCERTRTALAAAGIHCPSFARLADTYARIFVPVCELG